MLATAGLAAATARVIALRRCEPTSSLMLSRWNSTVNDLLEYIVDGVLRLFGVVMEAGDSSTWQTGVAIVLVVTSLIFVAVMIWIYCF